MAQPNLSGTWVLDRGDAKFEDFLKAMGANMIARKAAASVKPTLEVTQNGDNLKVKTITKIKTNEIEFTLGKEFEQKNEISGHMMKITPSMEDNKLVIKSVPKEAGKGKEVTVTREIVNDELHQTMQVEDITTVRYFKKK